MDDADRQVARQAQSVRRSADVLAETVGQAKDTADRRTELAADRTVLAAERTYAAWVRTGFAALASGVGARALLAKLPPEWLSQAAASLLVVFSIVCFAAAVWRELDPGAPPPRPDTRQLPKPVLLGLNSFLILLDVAVLIGIWVRPSSSP